MLDVLFFFAWCAAPIIGVAFMQAHTNIVNNYGDAPWWIGGIGFLLFFGAFLGLPIFGDRMIRGGVIVLEAIIHTFAFIFG